MAKIAIIGGGVAGLSAGIYAQLNGHTATVYERHAVAGGNLTGWQRGEYHIDNCIHWLTGTNPATDTYRMWETLGALGDGVEVSQGDVLFTCEYGGRTLSLCRDLGQMRRDMLALSRTPSDTVEIERLIRAIETVQGMSHIAGETHDRGYGVLRLMRSCPWLLRYNAMSTGELASRFSHPLLRRFATSFLGESFNSLALVVVCAHFCGENAGIPQGGSLAMARRMADRFEALGGKLYTGREALEIICRDGRARAVRFADGEVVEADYVILATDPTSVFGRMLDAPMPTRLKRWYDAPDMQRFSAYHCAFALDAPRPPFRGDLALDVPSRYWGALHANTIAVREFSHEPSFSPEGKTILQTVSFCDEAEARTCIALAADRDAYRERKAQIARVTERLLLERFPEMTGELTCIDVWTPATYRRFTGAETGSFMSFVLPAGRLPVRLGGGVRGIPNVILATQWQQAPGGLPIAAECGRRAIEIVARREASLKVTKRRAHATYAEWAT